MLGGYEGFGVGLVFLVTGLLLAFLKIRVFSKSPNPVLVKLRGFIAFSTLCLDQWVCRVW